MRRNCKCNALIINFNMGFLFLPDRFLWGLKSPQLRQIRIEDSQWQRGLFVISLESENNRSGFPLYI